MDIADIETFLEAPLPDDLRWLYRQQRTASQEGDENPFELLTPADVIEQTERHRKFLNLRGSGIFWKGWNSEFAAMHLKGPLRGRIYIWDYDGRADSVSYRSATSFTAAMRDAASRGDDWYTAKTDYYVDTQHHLHGSGELLPATDADLQTDLVDRQALQETWMGNPSADEADQHHYAYSYMALTPAGRVEEILPFLDWPDMWIQERACNILASRKVASAVRHLAGIVDGGLHNGVMAAIRALGKIGTAESKEVLIEEVAKEKRRGYGLGRALAEAGLETRFDSTGWYFRDPATGEWRPVP